MPSTLTRFRKLQFASILVPVVVLAIAGALFGLEVQQILSVTHWVDHTDEVIAQAHLLERLVVDMETGARGYRLTGDPSFLEPFHRGADALPQCQERMAALVQDNASQAGELRGVCEEISRWYERTREGLAQVHQPPTADEVQGMRERRALMISLRERLGHFIDQEERLKEARVARVRRVNVDALGGALVVLGLMALGLGTVGRRQLRQLASDYEAVMAREQDARRSLEANTRALREANESLEARVLTRTAEIARRSTEVASVNAQLEQSNAMLARSRLELMQVIEQLPESVLILLGDRIRFANAAAARLLRRPVKELLELDFPRLLAPEHLAAFRAGVAAAASGARDLSPFEVTVLLGGEDSAPLEVSIVPDIDFVDGIGTLVVARDLTEERKLQARLQLADRMASIGQLAAGVAHEVNNPLASVLTNVSLAHDELVGRGDPSPEAKELVAMLHDAVEGATRIRQIVKDLSLSARTDEERRGPVDLNHALESALKLTMNQVRHKAELVRALGPVPPVSASEPRLVQVFVNLLVNAAQAIPDGAAQAHRIRLSSGVEADGRAFVEVEDSGKGIAPEHLRRIFDPFFTTKPLGVGTGLGLSICHGIVTAYGGEITVQSSEGKGARFRVRMPPSGGFEAAPSGPAIEAVSGRRGRILVIDDEVGVTNSLRRVLGREHEIHVETDPLAALARFEKGERFDVILCDLMMPTLPGNELAERIVARWPEQEQALVFMTGGAFTPAMNHFLRTTTRPRLEKPFQPSEVRAFIAERLRPQNWSERPRFDPLRRS